MNVPYPIDAYLIVTLPRNVRRQYLMLANLITQGVDYHDIFFYPGIDARDYKYHMGLIADEATKEGFSFLQQFALDVKGTHVRQSAGNVALFWTWAKILKMIADSGKTVLLSWDDRFLMVKWHHLQRLISELYQAEDPFYFAQLRLRDGDTISFNGYQNIELPDHDYYTRYVSGNTHRSIFETLINTSFENTTEMFFQKGILGYDETMVLSPKGASWIYKQMVTMEDRSEALLKWQDTLSDEGLTTENVDADMRSRLNNDNWLCWELGEIAREGADNELGIYTPRHYSFNFVDEILEQGSDVMWQTEAKTNADLSVARIRFLDTL